MNLLPIAVKAAVLVIERRAGRHHIDPAGFGVAIIEYARGGPEPVWHLDIYEATVYGRLHDDEPARQAVPA